MKRYFTWDFSLLGATSLIWLVYILWLPLWTQDGPNHKQVLNLLQQTTTDPTLSHFFQSNIAFFQTNQLFHILYLRIFHFLSLDVYEKLFFGTFVLLQILGFRFFLKIWNDRDSSLWPLFLPFTLHLLYLRGFYNFMAGFTLSLYALAFAKKAVKEKQISAWIFTQILLLLIFWAHPFPFFVLIPCFAILLYKTTGSFQKFIAGELLLFSLFFWISGFLQPLFQKHEAVYSSSKLLFYAPWELLGGLLVFNFSLYKSWEIIFYIPLFLGYLYLAYYSLRNLAWSQKIYWLICLAGYLIFPKDAKGGGIINERFLPYVFCFIPLGIHFTFQKKKILLFMAFATWACSLFFIGKGSLSLVQDEKDAHVVLQSLPEYTRLYPMIFNQRATVTNPAIFTHLWAAAPYDKKTFSSSLFIYSSLMPLSPRGKSFHDFFPVAGEDLPHKIRECFLNSPNCTQDPYALIHQVLEKAKFYNYWYLYEPPPEILSLFLSNPSLKEVHNLGKSYLFQNKTFAEQK